MHSTNSPYLPRESTGAIDRVGHVQRGNTRAARRSLVAGAILLAGHATYTALQASALLFAWTPSFVDVPVLWQSFAVNLGLDVATVAFLLTLRLTGNRPGSRALVQRVTVLFSCLVIAVWTVQIHFGGSQSSQTLLLVMGTLLVIA